MINTSEHTSMDELASSQNDFMPEGWENCATYEFAQAITEYRKQLDKLSALNKELHKLHKELRHFF